MMDLAIGQAAADLGKLLIAVIVVAFGAGALVVKVPQWFAERHDKACHEQAAVLRTERDSLVFLVARPDCQSALHMGRVK